MLAIAILNLKIGLVDSIATPSVVIAGETAVINVTLAAAVVTPTVFTIESSDPVVVCL